MPDTTNQVGIWPNLQHIKKLAVQAKRSGLHVTKLKEQSKAQNSALVKWVAMPCTLRYSFYPWLCFGAGADPGGAIAPLKPTKITIHHDFLQFGKQHSRHKAVLSSILLSQHCCKVYFIPLTAAKPLWDLTTKYYWNLPPNVTGWIRPASVADRDLTFEGGNQKTSGIFSLFLFKRKAKKKTHNKAHLVLKWMPLHGDACSFVAGAIAPNFSQKSYICCSWTCFSCYSESYTFIENFAKQCQDYCEVWLVHHFLCNSESPGTSRMFKYFPQLIRPVTSLGHQGGRRVFWEGRNFFKLCPIVFNYAQHIFPGGAKNFVGRLRPMRPPGYGPAANCLLYLF